MTPVTKGMDKTKLLSASHGHNFEEAAEKGTTGCRRAFGYLVRPRSTGQGT